MIIEVPPSSVRRTVADTGSTLRAQIESLAEGEDTCPILLTTTTYMGTLAAVRHCGRLGIPMYLADARSVTPSRWSRYTSRRLKSPPISRPTEFLNWLLEYGEKEPGKVLYPACDETAWLFARHRQSLQRFYRLYSPSADVIARILNKKRLHEACADVGLETPPTVYPENEESLRLAAETFTYPALIKARTQVFWLAKGSVVRSSQETIRDFRDFRDSQVNQDDSLTGDPFLRWPMIQAFLPEAAEGIYSISGFIDDSGEQFVCRAARKVLQYPRRVGIGLCFESAPVDPELRDKIRALCRRTGYYGVFEAEFIQRNQDGRYLLIDFNPRYFNQMAFDIDRGMPLPEMTYRAALGQREALKRLVARAKSADTAEPRAYCHRWKFRLMLSLLTALGRFEPEEAGSWRSWLDRFDRGRRLTDPVADSDDRMPSLIDRTGAFLTWLRYPRSFIKEMLGAWLLWVVTGS
ncbi:MAG: hypothetical protein SFU56_15425 [Capsulimonadales bacterium]|nr:hypothetical protein [Capsulimonadales bacterium]